VAASAAPSLHHDIFVLGTSAGGVSALKTIAEGLPADFPGSLFMVIHTAPDSPGLMPQILNRAGPLPALYPEQGEAIRPGHIYVAPPDQHLILGPGHVHLSRAPRENATRPSVNPLFRSAARTYGPRVVGVILTGTLDDGTAGLITVEEMGGVTIVQDPSDADFGDMPESALTFVDVDHVLPLSDIAACLASLSKRPVTRGVRMEPTTDRVEEVELPYNEATGLACPECHGGLWEVQEGDLTEYRCRIGHLYSPDSLMHHLATRSLEEVESTYRALEEEVAMAEKMVERAVARNIHPGRTARFRRRAVAARARANAVAQAMTMPIDPSPEAAD
jgi:two-component system, chemotaxis family, protein-glutamate methylesterase/glutaminase